MREDAARRVRKILFKQASIYPPPFGFGLLVIRREGPAPPPARFAVMPAAARRLGARQPTDAAGANTQRRGFAVSVFASSGEARFRHPQRFTARTLDRPPVSAPISAGAGSSGANIGAVSIRRDAFDRFQAKRFSHLQE